ncbi:UNVERIFIED_ORG: hypothetical protein GGI63_004645 [Rhizobium esperanzae]
MQKYDLPISIFHRDSTEQGRLVIARATDAWQAEIWQGSWLLTSFDHTATGRNRGVATLGKGAFLERVRIIAEWVHGVYFELEAEAGI